MSSRVLFKCDACGREIDSAYGINLLVPPKQGDDHFRRLRADFDACSLPCLRSLVNRMIDVAELGDPAEA